MVIQYMIETAYKIRDCHIEGNIYFEKELLLTAYGWHNNKFPPEYREYTLTKKRGKAICKEYDFYYLFMEVSELIHEDLASLNRVLRSEVRKKRLKNSLTGWDDEVVRALFKLIRKGTARKPENRIRNYEELVQMPEWSLIRKICDPYREKAHRNIDKENQDGFMNSCKSICT